MDYMALSAAEWQQEYDKVSAEYESWKAKGLKLNMARGKPSKQQLDMVSGLLTALTSAEECVDNGVDARTAKSRGARKRASNGSAPRRAMTATSR